jgi:antitoxin CptB
MRELDLLLLGFLDSGYGRLDAAHRNAFELLLGYPDAVLLEWLLGRERPADPLLAHVVERIRCPDPEP